MRIFSGLFDLTTLCHAALGYVQRCVFDCINFCWAVPSFFVLWRDAILHIVGFFVFRLPCYGLANTRGLLHSPSECSYRLLNVPREPFFFICFIYRVFSSFFENFLRFLFCCFADFLRPNYLQACGSKESLVIDLQFFFYLWWFPLGPILCIF